MKFLVYVFILSSVFSQNKAFAGKTDNQAVIKTQEDKISVTIKKGYHLNAEAPANATFDDAATTFAPSLKTEKLFVFKKDKKAKKANLNFYVCDDKKTVCEPHQHTIELSSKHGGEQDGEQGGEPSGVADAKSEFNNIKEFSLKSENGKPTLLSFSAPWCPACIRMETETYNESVVKKQIEKLNFIKLNSDDSGNYELSQKFKVKAIPTIILLDKNGQEAYRWLDFQSYASFAKNLETELSKVDQAATTIKNAQLGDTAAASRLAFAAYNALDYAEALKWFSLTKSEKDQKFKLATEVSLSQEKAETNAKLIEDYLQTLQKAIVLTTSKLDQIRWSLDFFEKKKELGTLTEETKFQAKTFLLELDALVKNKKLAETSFLDGTYGNYAGFEKEELIWLKGRIYKVLEAPENKAKTDLVLSAAVSKKKLSAARPGEMLLAISYLKEAGEEKKVEELYQRLINKYPNSYVYYEKFARYAVKNSQFAKALDLADKALEFPLGNEPQLGLLKSQILKDLNKKTEALVVIEETLKKENILHQKFASTYKRLTELKKEITEKNK